MPTLQELIDAGFATEQVLSQEELDALCNIMTNKPEDADQDDSEDQEPVGWQHRKPICDSQGNVIGYSEWGDGKGLDWWPHRALYTAPPKPEWVSLTDDDIKQTIILNPAVGYRLMQMVRDDVTVSEVQDIISSITRATEAELRNKNNG